MSRRFQFSLRDLLWLVLAVAMFFGGMAWQRQLDAPLRIEEDVHSVSISPTANGIVELPDGSIWNRVDKGD
jgi:hypothetical protein